MSPVAERILPIDVAVARRSDARWLVFRAIGSRCSPDVAIPTTAVPLRFAIAIRKVSEALSLAVEKIDRLHSEGIGFAIGISIRWIAEYHRAATTRRAIEAIVYSKPSPDDG